MYIERTFRVKDLIHIVLIQVCLARISDAKGTTKGDDIPFRGERAQCVRGRQLKPR